MFSWLKNRAFHRPAIPSPWPWLREFFAGRATRELLLWCLPALVLGLALRIALSMHLPYAYFHDDTPAFLDTTHRWLTRHEFEVHEKKTFLVPILYTLAVVLPVPAIITIPIFQHALGLGLVLIIGALCRLWLVKWRAWILPLTCLVAANPFLLWWEHVLMAETAFVFCTALVALAGTLYARRPSRSRFAFLCVALVLVAGARPEGKLFFGFGLLLLALLHAREWRTVWGRLAVFAVVALFTHRATKTSQGGLLLYTAVARLTPTELRCAPGFDPSIAPIRATLQERWKERPQFPRVRERKAISAAVKEYLAQQEAGSHKVSHSESNQFCLQLARETCRRNLSELPGLALLKFRLKARDTPAGLFDRPLLFEKQRGTYLEDFDDLQVLGPGLLGVALPDEIVLHTWIDQHYAVVPWFNRLSVRWLAAVNRWHLPDAQYSPSFVNPGVPLYFVLGGVGLLATMLRRGKEQRFHVAWGLTLLGFFLVIMLTANVRPRFRLVFEPFWFLYIALLLESVGLLLAAPFRRKTEIAGPRDIPPPTA